MSLKVARNEKNEERMAIALKLGQPDAVPVDIVNLCSFLSGWLKIDAYDYFKNPGIMLESQLKFRDRFRGMGIIGPDYGVAVEPSCFGAKIVWPKNDPPWAIQMIDDVDDIPDFAEGLKIPDPLMSGYSPLAVSTYYYMEEQVGELAAPPKGTLGPFELGCMLLGTENMMLGIKLYPDDVHKLIKKLTEFVKNLLEARHEVLGLDMDVIYMGEDNPGCLSAKDFEEFVVPYTGSIFKSLGNSDSIRMWHCDGSEKQLLDVIPKLGINALTSFDPWTDLSLDDAAKVLFVNPAYLSRLFKREVGETFTHYLMKLRIENAKKLLKDSYLKIYEISELVGYKNERYFSRIFKDFEGITPNEYRDRIPGKQVVTSK